jgi:hypothetical protein
LALLQGITEAWDLISPRSEENVDCDGPVVTGYWKYTGADLLAHTNNDRRRESLSGRFNGRTFARKECEVVPDTEVFLSIDREQNMGGRFPTTTPSFNDRPASTAPAGVWAGTWVDQTDVGNSRIIVQVTNPPSGRSRPGGPRLWQCNVTAEASYNVSIKELAAPSNGTIDFQHGSNCVRPEQVSSGGTSAAVQPGLRTDGVVAGQRNSGIATRPRPGGIYEQQPRVGVTPRPLPTEIVTPQVAVHLLKATPNITLELFEAYNNNTVVGYRLRYLRKADDGSVIKDVKLSHPGDPIR